MQLSRLQRIYQAHRLTYDVLEQSLTIVPTLKSGQAYFFSCKCTNGEDQCLVSMDSDLEAFSRNPTHGSFAAMAFQPAAFTNYAN